MSNSPPPLTFKPPPSLHRTDWEGREGVEGIQALIDYPQRTCIYRALALLPSKTESSLCTTSCHSPQKKLKGIRPSSGCRKSCGRSQRFERQERDTLRSSVHTKISEKGRARTKGLCNARQLVVDDRLGNPGFQMGSLLRTREVLLLDRLAAQTQRQRMPVASQVAVDGGRKKEEREIRRTSKSPSWPSEARRQA